MATKESGFRTTLKAKLSPGDTTMTVATAPTITAGRIFIKSGNTKEWISFTGNPNPGGSNVTLTGLTRQLSQTADPATSGGSGETWLAGTAVVIVAMHDQLLDKLDGEQALVEAKTYVDTTARDAALGGDGVATKAYTGIYTTAEGLFWNYNLSSNQREDVDTGTTTPNASTTVAGKVEEATQTESDEGAATGGTGAVTVPSAQNMGRSIQKQAHIYGASSAGTDTYAITLSPAPTAYATGMKVVLETDVANTGACTLNVNSLGAKDIKLKNGSDPGTLDIEAGEQVDLIYDGTNFVLQKDIPSTLETDKTTGESFTGGSVPFACYVSDGTGSRTSGYIYKTDTNDGTYTDAINFFGFVVDSISSGVVANVKTSGVIGGFTGLTPGAKVYLSDTTGAISETPSTTKNIPVGYAVSATSIKIETEPTLYATGTFTRDISAATGAVNVAHGLSRLPRKVTLHYVRQGQTPATGPTKLIGEWVNGTENTIGVLDAGASTDVGLVTGKIFSYINSSGDGQTANLTVDATNLIFTYAGNTSLSNVLDFIRTAEA